MDGLVWNVNARENLRKPTFLVFEVMMGFAWTACYFRESINSFQWLSIIRENKANLKRYNLSIPVLHRIKRFLILKVDMIIYFIFMIIVLFFLDSNIFFFEIRFKWHYTTSLFKETIYVHKLNVVLQSKDEM